MFDLTATLVLSPRSGRGRYQMHHLYTGTGTTSDNSGGTRALSVTASISDVLRDWQTSDPVTITPGTALPSALYAYDIAGWQITVQGLGMFIGSRGRLYIELLASNELAAVEWFLESDAGGWYTWAGDITTFDQPTRQNWPLPTNPGFAQLPRIIGWAGLRLGPAIEGLVKRPDGMWEVEFTLTRV